MVLNTLLIILGTLQLIDVLIMIALYYIFNQSPMYKYGIFLWLGMNLLFISDYLLGPVSRLHPLFSFSFILITGFYLAKLLASIYEIELNFKKFLLLDIVCYSLAVLAYFMGLSFEWIAFPISIGIVSPLIYSIYSTVKRRVGSYETSAVEKAYIMILLIWAIHFLDYPFLRSLSDERVSIFGFSLALFLTYCSSILIPVVINKKIHLNFQEYLNSKILEKERELERSKEQIWISEKLATVGTMTAGVAHEIKNPLFVINNSVQLVEELNDEIMDDLKQKGLKEQLSSSSIELIREVKELTRRIQLNTDRVNEIVNDMLSLTQSDGDWDIVNMKQFVEDVVKESLQVAEKKYDHPIITNIDLRDVGLRRIMPEELSHVISNMIDNAVYSMLFKMKNGHKDLIPELRVELVDREGQIALVIGDNGEGISKEVKEKMFDPFFTTKPTGEGTGLGLSLATDIIKRHNGDINVDSLDGEGTVFTICIR